MAKSNESAFEIKVMDVEISTMCLIEVRGQKQDQQVKKKMAHLIHYSWSWRRET